MSNSSRIAVLTVPNDHSWALINALSERFGSVQVLAEQREPPLDLIRKRTRRVGLLKVLGQIGFVLLQRFTARTRRARVAEIVRQSALRIHLDPTCPVHDIRSVNSAACREALARLAPQVIVVSGTRLISRDTLDAINVPILNVHMGWNPGYRGQAGGYWAVAEGDTQHAGVTIHLVDSGVDTGPILYRTTFSPTRRDSFGTYFYLQSAVARPMLIRAVEDALSGRLAPVPTTEPSRMFVHPTLWRYLWTGCTKGVW